MEGCDRFQAPRSHALPCFVAYLAAVSVALPALVGCAHAPRSDGGAVGQVIHGANGVDIPAFAINSPGKTDSPSSGSVAPMIVWGKKLRHSKFDIPVTLNPSVEKWLNYFTGKGRKFFEKYLARSEYFVPTISKVLKSHNMPQDLVYLAMIESGFNNSAKSRARAVGPWQFIRQTGQRYGLVVDYWLDERRDTRKSTLAAIGYLKELYQEFGSWELAAAGYNAGENKVRRAIAKYKVNDFWEISRHRFFKRETRDYVPKIMAAAILSKNAELFGFVDPLQIKHGNAKNVTLAKADAQAGTATAVTGNAVSDEEISPKELGEPVSNLEDTKEDVKEDPADKEEVIAEVDEDIAAPDEDDMHDTHAVVSQNPNPAFTPSVYMVNNPNEQIIEFEVKGPADLFAVSKASGLPYSALKMLNPEVLRWCTPPYMGTYRIKLPLSVKDRFLATYNDEAFDRRVVFLRYTVRRGDTITRVAKRFGIEPSPIRELNQFPMGATYLKVGSAINLPVPTGYKRVIAGMYDDKPLPPSKRGRARRHRRPRHYRQSVSHELTLAPSVRIG